MDFNHGGKANIEQEDAEEAEKSILNPLCFLCALLLFNSFFSVSSVPQW